MEVGKDSHRESSPKTSTCRTRRESLVLRAKESELSSESRWKALEMEETLPSTPQIKAVNRVRSDSSSCRSQIVWSIWITPSHPCTSLAFSRFKANSFKSASLSLRSSLCTRFRQDVEGAMEVTRASPDSGRTPPPQPHPSLRTAPRSPRPRGPALPLVFPATFLIFWKSEFLSI